ncbi:hypothetical protein LX83_000517 [Goodfellowiella coeruleoviolacea]|uniref:Uncharacterized protein n=1 Tax=Goodfellowiella coeruleoviolacea TaxID=334858 RepID=A0AAE3GAF0_9PSEU|nr:hypothetical protein [Goodfellowiella coeruleoviolacea]
MHARGVAGATRFPCAGTGTRGGFGSGESPSGWQDVDRVGVLLEVAVLETLTARHRARPGFLSSAMSVVAASTGQPVRRGHRGVPGAVAAQAGSGEGRPAGVTGLGHAIARSRSSTAENRVSGDRRGCAAVPPRIRRAVFTNLEES